MPKIKSRGMGSCRGRKNAGASAECRETEELVVAACARGEGVGKELLQRAISIARAGGCEIIELSSNSARTDAHRFYEREGFKRTHVKLTMALI